MEDDRARMIGAAWTVLDRSGFEGFKVQLVLREADVSARVFYREFADKDELFLALLRDEMARAAPRLRAAVARVEQPTDKVATWIQSIIGAAGDPRRVARARLFSSLPTIMRRFPREVEEGTALLREPLRDAIADGRDAGVFPWADPEVDARLVYQLAGSALTSSLSDEPQRSLDAVVPETITFVLRALGVPPRTDLVDDR